MNDDRWCTCGHLQVVHDDDGCLELTRRRRCRCPGFNLADSPPAKAQKIDAERIIGLLRQRHAEDVFVAECKNGATHYPGKDGLLKFDAWVMTKSWAHWATIGYEVKVNRSDFNQDQKWVGYLPYCHQFWFVCPGGLIRSTDLPEYVGLIWVSQNGERLHVKRRAAVREVDDTKLMRLMTYVLMSRSVIVADMHEANRAVPPEERARRTRLADQQDWLTDAEERHHLAMMVRGHVRQYVDAADHKLSDAQALSRTANEFADRLARLGIVWDPSTSDWGDRYRVEREIDMLVGACDPHTLRVIEAAGKGMLAAVEKLNELRKQSAAKAAGASE